MKLPRTSCEISWNLQYQVYGWDLPKNIMHRSYMYVYKRIVPTRTSDTILLQGGRDPMKRVAMLDNGSQLLKPSLCLVYVNAQITKTLGSTSIRYRVGLISNRSWSEGLLSGRLSASNAVWGKDRVCYIPAIHCINHIYLFIRTEMHLSTIITTYYPFRWQTYIGNRWILTWMKNRMIIYFGISI